MLNGVIRQFLYQAWGELDYLIVICHQGLVMLMTLTQAVPMAGAVV